MGKAKEMRLHLNEKYALTDKEVKAATKEAKRMGRLPDFSKAREVKPLPTDTILKNLNSSYLTTEFQKVYKEFNELVIVYTGKKPKGIKKDLKKYI